MHFAEIKEFEDSDESIHVTLQDRRLPLITLKTYFPYADGLFYRVDNKVTAVGMCGSVEEPCFTEPHDGWENKKYFAKRRTSRPCSSIEVKTPADIEKYFDYLLYILNGENRACVTLVEKNLALTANHCIPGNKKLGDKLNVFDQNGKSYEVSIVFQHQTLDLVFLQTVGSDFEVEPLEVGSYAVGKDYFALGYASDADTGIQFVKCPNVIKGSIMTSVVRNSCVYGSSGGAKGFSGGPVISISSPRHLIGVTLGGRGLPRSWPLDVFMVRMLAFCEETPRLKIFPMASALAILTATNESRKGVKRSASDPNMSE